MTVKELILELEKLDPKATIVTPVYSDNYYTSFQDPTIEKASEYDCHAGMADPRWIVIS